MLMVQNCSFAHSIKLCMVQNCDVARERVKIEKKGKAFKTCTLAKTSQVIQTPLYSQPLLIFQTVSFFPITPRA